MTNIDARAAIEAVKDLVPLDVTGHVRRCDYPDCDCFTLPTRFAAAVDAARAEGEKQGAARVREAVEAIHRPEPDDGTTPFCHGCWEAGGYDGAPTWPCATIRALTEAAPHD